MNFYILIVLVYFRRTLSEIHYFLWFKIIGQWLCKTKKNFIIYFVKNQNQISDPFRWNCNFHWPREYAYKTSECVMRIWRKSFPFSDMYTTFWYVCSDWLPHQDKICQIITLKMKCPIKFASLSNWLDRAWFYSDYSFGQILNVIRFPSIFSQS